MKGQYHEFLIHSLNNLAWSVENSDEAIALRKRPIVNTGKISTVG